MKRNNKESERATPLWSWALWAPLSALALLLSGCEEFFEVRLDQTVVNIIIPSDSLRTPVATQTFWWDDVYGADEYRIQIVSPHFDSIYTLITDEFVDTSRFNYTLHPGTYQWRVKALNYATETPWATRTLIIDSTLDLSSQTLVLLSPLQNDTSNTLVYTLRWQSLYNADVYRYEVWQPALNGTLVEANGTTGSAATITLLAEGAFLWRVRAENALGNTPYSIRQAYADTTAPQLSVPVSPAHAAVLPSRNVSFSWLRAADNGSSVRDSIVVATDQLFNQVVTTYSTRAVNVADSLASGVYYWRIYTKDKAGNQRGPTLNRTFTLP
jgi:hypothetical protein